jgi:hypothetical protein
MPISQDELRLRYEKAKQGIDTRVVALEADIDKMLGAKPLKPGQQVPYGLPMDESAEVIKKIIDDYAAVGVKVTRYQGVPRDACNNLVFQYE